MRRAWRRRGSWLRRRSQSECCASPRCGARGDRRRMDGRGDFRSGAAGAGHRAADGPHPGSRRPANLVGTVHRRGIWHGKPSFNSVQWRASCGATTTTARPLASEGAPTCRRGRGDRGLSGGGRCRRVREAGRRVNWPGATVSGGCDRHATPARSPAGSGSHTRPASLPGRRRLRHVDGHRQGDHDRTGPWRAPPDVVRIWRHRVRVHDRRRP